LLCLTENRIAAPESNRRNAGLKTLLYHLGALSKNNHSTLERCEVAKLGVRGTKCEGRKLMPLKDGQKNIMKLFNCKYLGESGYLKSLGIK